MLSSVKGHMHWDKQTYPTGNLKKKKSFFFASHLSDRYTHLLPACLPLNMNNGLALNFVGL